MEGWHRGSALLSIAASWNDASGRHGSDDCDVLRNEGCPSWIWLVSGLDSWGLLVLWTLLLSWISEGSGWG